MILITGATGTNGQEVIKQLAATGRKVRALVRNRSKAAKLEGPNVEIAEGDFDNPASLASALQGVEAAFFLSTFNARYANWWRNFQAAALQARTPRVVKFSAMNADPASRSAILRLHGETDELLRESGLAYTILQPNSFYQNLLWSLDSIKSQGVFYLPLRDAKQSCVDVRDIATVATKALTQPDHAGRTYVLTGPEALTYSDVAKKLSVALGKEIRYVDVPPAAAKESMLKAGMAEWEARALVELFGLFADGAAAQVTNIVQTLTGRPARSFAEFAREFAALVNR